jgi:GT2 family glycosyltransferase
MAEPPVSIIIRTYNEERWISQCLQAVGEQSFKDYEIILVDNQSTDDTVRKAREFPVKIVTIAEYLPGKAMNTGIRASRGKYLVFLSGHCIPTGPQWLESLVAGFKDEKAAGVYGRQQPMTFSSPQDIRDLTISFGLDRRIQWKDPFFHNANSAIRRDLWEKYPFDETVTNIEDRLWAETVLAAGYCIIYEPEASVYHHHGIHHGNKEARLKTTVKVLERLHGNNSKYEAGQLDPAKQRITAFVPQRGQSPLMEDNRPVLELTLASAARSKYIHETVVLTDNPSVVQTAEKYNASVPFLRPEEYSRDDVDLNSVYSYCLERLEAGGWAADIVICMEPTYPFRPPGLIDDLIQHLLKGGYDSVIPVRAEYNPCWLENEHQPQRIYEGEIPRHLRTPLLVGLKGIACVTYPEFLRQGRLLGDNVGLVRISDPFAAMEVRSQIDHQLAELVRGANL